VIASFARRACLRLALAWAVAVPGVASAHLNGIPTIAWPEAPAGVGEVADSSFRISWTDFDDQATTGFTTIDIHATRRMPPTYRMGVAPRIEDGPDHVVIATGIPERDFANEVEWDTSAVPSGTWFVWTVAHDDPFEMWAFARGVVSVAHGDEAPWPAVVVTRPDEGTPAADESALLRYESFDPDGTGRVTLEASRALGGGEPVTLASDLPADASGSFEWDTRDVEAGDWTIKATIVDARGLTSSAYARFFVRVAHRPKGTGGTGGGGGGSGGVGGDGGAIGAGGHPEGGEGADDAPAGCGCGAGRADGAIGLALAVVLLGRRRNGCGSAPSTPA